MSSELIGALQDLAKERNIDETMFSSASSRSLQRATSAS